MTGIRIQIEKVKPMITQSELKTVSKALERLESAASVLSTYSSKLARQMDKCVSHEASLAKCITAAKDANDAITFLTKYTDG